MHAEAEASPYGLLSSSGLFGNAPRPQMATLYLRGSANQSVKAATTPSGTVAERSISSAC
jgi:hypothetical protein